MSKHREKRVERERIIREKEETARLVEEKETEIEKDYEPQEECECHCREIWKDYRSCLEFSFLGVFSCFMAIKKGLYNCFGACCFPIKERFCNCCDNIDRDLNPYKNPNYNPYDYL